MAYERDDYRRGYGGGDRNRFSSGGDYGRDRSNYGRYGRDDDDDDRGFFDRAGDEVRSWFGDDDAQRRRERDMREDEARYGRDYPRSGYNQPVGGGRFTDDRSGRDYGAPNYGPPSYQRQGQSGSNRQGYGQQRQTDHDPHYSAWRQQQIDALDRDYEEYRRENQSKFENDFGGWRTTRQGQRSMVQKVDEHMEVIGTDGEKIGTVDKVRGDRIILTKNDPEAGGRHHSIPCSWIQSVDDKVTINKSAIEAKAAWKDEERSSAFFGSDDRDDDNRGRRGAHNLNRAFSGTY
jgi:hypothetical protein